MRSDLFWNVLYSKLDFRSTREMRLIVTVRYFALPVIIEIGTIVARQTILYLNFFLFDENKISYFFPINSSSES